MAMMPGVGGGGAVVYPVDTLAHVGSISFVSPQGRDYQVICLGAFAIFDE